METDREAFFCFGLTAQDRDTSSFFSNREIPFHVGSGVVLWRDPVIRTAADLGISLHNSFSATGLEFWNE